MDHEKCLKRRKYCNRIQFGEICLRPVAGDEVFEETKGCGDEMSICVVSLLIPPFRATIIGCIYCFYYSESDLLLSMTALFWLFYTYPCPNITHTPHVGLYPVKNDYLISILLTFVPQLQTPTPPVLYFHFITPFAEFWIIYLSCLRTFEFRTPLGTSLLLQHGHFQLYISWRYMANT